MGYFDGLVEAAFKTDREGRSVYYPWGVMGRGRVLRDAADERRIRLYLKLYYIVAFVPTILLISVCGLAYAFAAMAVMTVIHLAAVQSLTRGLELTSDRLTFRQAYASSGRALGSGTLYVLLALSVFMTAASLLVLVFDRVLVGLAGTAFFGLCTGLYAYMIRARKSA